MAPKREIVDPAPLTCFVAYVLPTTRWTVVAAAAMFAASFAPFLYIEFWGSTPVDVLAGLLAQAQAATDDTSLVRLGAVVVLSFLFLAAHVAMRVAKECSERRRAYELGRQSELMV